MCIRLGEMLAQSGQEVFYLTSPTTKGYDIPSELHFVDTSLMGWRFLTSNLPIDVWGYRSALGLLKQLGPDIVHFVARGLFPGVMSACIRLGILTIFTVVDQYLVCPKANLRNRNRTNCDTFHGIRCGSCMRYDSGGPIFHTLGTLGGGYLASWVRVYFIDWLGRRLWAIVTLSDTSKR